MLLPPIRTLSSNSSSSALGASPKMKRSASSGRMAARGGTDGAEGADGKNARSAPRVESAPGRLDKLDKLAAGSQSDLSDVAYFAPPAPSKQLGGDTSVETLGPNALSLRAPGAHVGANLDRGGVSVSEQANIAPGSLDLTGTRNLGGSSVGGSIDAPADRPDHHAKVGLAAASNGQTLALAPSVAYRDLLKDEVGLGVAVFGSAHSGVRVLGPDERGEAGEDHDPERPVPIESRHASSLGVALDPRLTWAPAWLGGFFKLVKSRAEENLFRLAVRPRHAGQLLARQTDEGLAGPLRNWFRQWSQVARERPSLRTPNIEDPFADAGGRALQPGETLVRHRTDTRIVGAGAGLLGVRAGRYQLNNAETQATVRCLHDRQVTLAISPRTSESTSHNADTPLGPNLQRVDTRASGALSERVFDLADPAQKQSYLRLLRGMAADGPQDPPAPSPHLTERATLTASDESRGVTRVPFRTSWGGYGEQLTRYETNTSSDAQGRLSQSREVVGQITQHALEQGKNTWRIAAASHASSVRPPSPTHLLAFRGLAVSADRSATRPDLAMRHNMTEEHARLWRREMTPVEAAPRSDYKISAGTVFSGRQLAALERAMPERAAALAQACGAPPESLIALIADLRNASAEAPLDSALERAWRRSRLVSDYLQATGAVGLAALHRLLGGRLDIRTDSTAYTEPLQALRELSYLPRPSRKRADKVAGQLRTALQAARADGIMRAHDRKRWLRLTATLEHAIGAADRLREA